MDVAVPPHPAKFSPNVLAAIGDVVHAEATTQGRRLWVLDPFAGVGLIHTLHGEACATFGVELEPEWAHAHERTFVGDATKLPECWTALFDVLATSCTYGNRMADTYDGRDGRRRHTYTISLGRKLSDNSSAGMQWGSKYRELHEAAWAEAMRVVKPGGLIVLNVKNHVRDDRLQHVTEWHLRKLIDLGCYVESVAPIDTRGMRHGQNHEKRSVERLLVLRRP